MPEAERGQGESHRLAFRFYVLFAPLLYLLFALLTPPFQTPDEQQHLYRAYQLSTLQLFGERSGTMSGGHLPPGLAVAAAKELRTVQLHDRKVVHASSWSEHFTRATPIGQGEPAVFTNFLGSASYSPAGYVPQVVAVWIGRALDLPVEWIVRLGRVFNAALAFALLCAAFRALPAGRSVLLVVGLLPMTAACAGSFGQDGLIIGASAWIAALSLRALLAGSWTSGDGRRLVALAVAVTLAKIVYLPLAGLALVLRDAGGRLRLSRAPMEAIAVAGAAVAGWVLLNAGLVVPGTPDLPSPGAQLAYVLAHPSAFPTALANRFSGAGLDELVNTLFLFGWLNVGPVYLAMWASAAALVLAVAQGDALAAQLRPGWRAWAALVSVGILLAICLIMYLAASPLGARMLYGVQGRYLIPLILPLGVAIIPRQRRGDALLVKAAAGLMVFACVIALNDICKAFYI